MATSRRLVDGPALPLDFIVAGLGTAAEGRLPTVGSFNRDPLQSRVGARLSPLGRATPNRIEGGAVRAVRLSRTSSGGVLVRPGDARGRAAVLVSDRDKGPTL